MSKNNIPLGKILREIKLECDKVRSIQHILSRKYHASVTSTPLSQKSKKVLDIDTNLVASKVLLRRSSIVKEIKDINFGSVFTNHMLKIEYDEKCGGWQQPQISPLEEISLHPASRVLQYAITMFEGMKAFRGVDGNIRLFRPHMNLNRLNGSAERSALPQIDTDHLLGCIERLVSIEQDWVPSYPGSLYIRPTIIATDKLLGLGWPTSALLYVISSPVGSYFSNSNQSVRLLADPAYVRAWHGGCGDKKMGSNYAPTTYVQKIANEKGCNQVLWLYGKEEELTEAGTMNIFVVYINDKGETELLTPPLNGLILPGVTRSSVLELARNINGLSVVEKTITMAEIINLQKEKRLLEFFGSGTAATVCPVSEIYYKGQYIHIPTMESNNPLFRQLLQTIHNIQYGRISHPWAYEINVSDQVGYKLQAEQ